MSSDIKYSNNNILIVDDENRSYSYLDFEDFNKKRRSKIEIIGRSFSCKHCDKTYLSEIALDFAQKVLKKDTGIV